MNAFFSEESREQQPGYRYADAQVERLRTKSVH